MANATYDKVIVADTAATIISATPIWIRKIVLIPNAAADAATLKFWETNQPYAAGAGTYSSDAILGTITGNATLTMASGTLLPNTCLDGDVFKITGGNGANTNTTNVITTAGNNTVIICANAGWTNEAGKTYHFITYPTRPAFSILSQATSAKQEELDFGGGGFWLPNLTLETLSSSAKIYIYLR